MLINVQDAKANLSRLVDAAMLGDEVIIAKAGKPHVRLVPVEQPPRAPGALKGKFAFSDAFLDSVFDPLSEAELRLWE